MLNARFLLLNSFNISSTANETTNHIWPIDLANYLEIFTLDHRREKPVVAGFVADVNHFLIRLPDTALELDQFFPSGGTGRTNPGQGQLQGFAFFYVT